MTKKYIEVNRKPVVGDKVKIVEAERSYGKYENGDIITANSVSHGGIRSDEVVAPRNQWGLVLSREFVVVEEVVEPGVGSGSVTILEDKSIGGVMREYREVRREVVEGDIVKYAYGRIATAVLRMDAYDHDNTYVSTANGDGDAVVLEPTDVVHIGSERFRMVERKAEVGERVIITNWLGGKHADPTAYKNGDTAIVHGSLRVVQLPNDDDLGYVTVLSDEFRVLEPLPTELSSRPAYEQSAEIIATLTSEVESLKKRVAALEKPPIIRELVGEDLRKIVKSPQQIRDEIVERAKKDIGAQAYKRGSYDVDGRECHVEFFVNTDKRSITAVLRGAHTKKVRATGRAVCSDNDVFNVHIGRAIALRRALGLEVPAEYLTAPQPTEVRVGDIVRWSCDIEDVPDEISAIVSVEGASSPMAVEYYFEDGDFDYLENISVIDDSREEELRL